MKSSNKIVLTLAMAALFASCAEKELPDSTVIPVGQSEAVIPTEIVATFEETKVTYEEYDAGSVYNLRPAWEVGDEIIAIDGDDNTKSYTFTVKTVNAGKSAVLSGEVPENCSLHLIWCPGISASNLSVDYTAQTGAQKTMPAVMFSDGEVVDGTGHFSFRNAGAIIGISAVKGVPQGSAITKITVSGSNLSAATIALSGSPLKLALTATTKANDTISVNDLDLTVTDANGTLSVPVYLAVPAGATIKRVSATLAARTPETMTIPSTAADKKDIDYVEIAAKYDRINVTTKKWAKWNVGANSETDYGWYFAWGATEGYVYKNSTWVSVSGVDSYYYTLSSPYTTEARDYVYVKTQIFTGYGFYWKFHPFNPSGSEYDETYFNSVKNTVCPDNTLALEYDAARANWGEPWRMPTSEEFVAMYQACGGGSSYSMWYYELSSSTPDKGVYWVSETQAYIPEYTGVAGLLFCDGTNKLFFPAAGKPIYDSLDSTGSSGYYCSSSLMQDSETNTTYCMYFRNDITLVRAQGSSSPCNGLCVRPLSDY